MSTKTTLVAVSIFSALATAAVVTGSTDPAVVPDSDPVLDPLQASVAASDPGPSSSQDIRDVPCNLDPATAISSNASSPSCPSSPFTPPEANDSTFVTDCAGSLDTGCTFRDGSPLVFTIKIGRVIGDKAKLKAAGLIPDTVTVQMPAFDVDFFGGGGVFNPERDRVSINGHVVPGEFLQGDNNVWRLNEFSVPIEWVNFPEDPGVNGKVTPVDNTIQIDIDTANTDLVWCTSIDWAAIHIDVPRPIVFVHGILSKGAAWNKEFSWINTVSALGIPNRNDLDMGNLDSIQNNAEKIAAKVESAKQQWGVDKVNLVCHSKGGLDSRHFVENNDSVEQVIQLGTPNAGSPLADVVQGILVRTIGLPNTALLDILATPAGYQLTQPYMALYNAIHGPNPNVRYTALAGNYDPRCRGLNRINPFCHPLERILLSITGTGDTIVPVTSVHALPYTDDRDYPSFGDDLTATHTQLNNSAGVFGRVRDRVVAPGTNSATAPDPVPSIARTATTTGTIQQGQVLVQTIPIDQATPAYFSLMYASGNLDLALISPSGVRYDAATIVGNPDVGRDEQEVLGGFIEVFNFAAPEVGIWTAEISAPSVVDPSGSTGFALTGWLEDPAITLHGTVEQPNLHAGDPLRLLATVRNGASPLTGAAASARIALPDGTAVDLALHDDGAAGDAAAGDGIYTAELADTSQAGNYRIVFEASSGAPAFSREDFTVATVSASRSTITGPFTDTGIDSDGDGLFNQLRLQVPLDITTPSTYRLVGVLTDSAGNTLIATRNATLGAGSTTLALDFDGPALFRNGVDGPYRIALRLVEDSELAILPVDDRPDAHRTAAYSFRAFQHAPLSLNGTGSARGVDLDGNGRFDQLVVTVGVEVLRSGFYQWSGRLTDRNGRDLGFDSRTGFLAAGASSFTFTFDGRAIGANGVDGPYFVRSLLAFGAGTSLVVSNAFATQAFSASQFEGFANDTTPPTLDVSLSPSVLWPPDHRLVSIQATITASDDRDPNPRVELVSITSNEPVNGTGDGNTDPDIQGAELGADDRAFSLRAERSGGGGDRIYTITYVARDAAGNETTATSTVTVPHDQR
ncbi:MAG TPA: choice-of-anchor X domain-containing protein [Kofleriaceae bacterium]|nr:choice-of-anchor X domain-containing protein [Kofleriaceae bacterium]